MNYIGDADSQFRRIGATKPGVGSVMYHSIEGSYRFDDQLTLRAGINNLFDEKPEFEYASYPVSAMGRYFYLGARMNFGP